MKLKYLKEYFNKIGLKKSKNEWVLLIEQVLTTEFMYNTFENEAKKAVEILEMIKKESVLAKI